MIKVVKDNKEQEDLINLCPAAAGRKEDTRHGHGATSPTCGRSVTHDSWHRDDDPAAVTAADPWS
jgi:hypothetical protein